MKNIWLAIIMSTIMALYAAPVAADGITAVVLPHPIGLPEIILVLGFLVCALWKKDWIRIVLSLCVIIWGVFAMPYDIKIAAPLVGVGSVLFIQGILNQISRMREAT